MADDGWLAAPAAVGVVFLGMGLVGVIGSYASISIAKNVELIGVSHSEAVDPKPWYVAVHRVGAFVALVVGFVLLDGIALR